MIGDMAKLAISSLERRSTSRARRVGLESLMRTAETQPARGRSACAEEVSDPGGEAKKILDGGAHGAK
jgi:hypothetical protein